MLSPLPIFFNVDTLSPEKEHKENFSVNWLEDKKLIADLSFYYMYGKGRRFLIEESSYPSIYDFLRNVNPLTFPVLIDMGKGEDDSIPQNILDKYINKDDLWLDLTTSQIIHSDEEERVDALLLGDKLCESNNLKKLYYIDPFKDLLSFKDLLKIAYLRKVAQQIVYNDAADLAMNFNHFPFEFDYFTSQVLKHQDSETDNPSKYHNIQALGDFPVFFYGKVKVHENESFEVDGFINIFDRWNFEQHEITDDMTPEEVLRQIDRNEATGAIGDGFNFLDNYTALDQKPFNILLANPIPFKNKGNISFKNDPWRIVQNTSKSSFIRNAYFDGRTMLTDLQLNDMHYAYPVPYKTWEVFTEAISFGKDFNDYIKPYYGYVAKYPV